MEISRAVSAGNAAAVSVADYLDFYADDDETAVGLAYLEGIADGAHVYFVHSYFCDAPPEVTIASSDYGRDFAAIVGRDHVLPGRVSQGAQGHPQGQ